MRAPEPIPDFVSASSPARASPLFASDSGLALPTWMCIAGIASARRIAVATPAAHQRRRTTPVDQRVQKRLASRSVRSRGRSIHGPIVARITGSSVIDTSTLTIGISIPA